MLSYLLGTIFLNESYKVPALRMEVLFALKVKF